MDIRRRLINPCGPLVSGESGFDASRLFTLKLKNTECGSIKLSEVMLKGNTLTPLGEAMGTDEKAVTSFLDSM